MKFSTQQLLLIILSTVLLTMAVLRFLFLGHAGFDIGATVLMVVVALCGLYGAWKLDHTALLIFFIAMIIMLVLDCILLIVSMSNCKWGWCRNSLAYIVVSILIEIIGAILAHRLRHGHHSHVLIHI